MLSHYACLSHTCRHINTRPSPLSDGAVCDKCRVSLHHDHSDHDKGVDSTVSSKQTQPPEQKKE